MVALNISGVKLQIWSRHTILMEASIWLSKIKIFASGVNETFVKFVGPQPRKETLKLPVQKLDHQVKSRKNPEQTRVQKPFILIFLQLTGLAYAKWACCSYGTAHSKETTGYDCAKIPGPLKTGGTTFNAGAMGFCGGELGTAGAIAAATVCCKFFMNILVLIV